MTMVIFNLMTKKEVFLLNYNNNAPLSKEEFLASQNLRKNKNIVIQKSLLKFCCDYR